jgi:hypothetical protein
MRRMKTFTANFPSFGEIPAASLALFEGERVLTGAEIAKALRIPQRKFRTLEESGDGPPYFRFGKKTKRYPLSAARVWVATHLEITVKPETPA